MSFGILFRRDHPVKGVGGGVVVDPDAGAGKDLIAVAGRGVVVGNGGNLFDIDLFRKVEFFHFVYDFTGFSRVEVAPVGKAFEEVTGTEKGSGRQCTADKNIFPILAEDAVAVFSEGTFIEKHPGFGRLRSTSQIDGDVAAFEILFSEDLSQLGFEKCFSRFVI